MNYDIITIGSATRDVFLQIKALHTHPAKDAITHIEAALPFGAKINVEQIHFDTGGGATNSAATFAHLGKFRVAALTRVGQDSAGRDIVAALKYNRVDTALIQHAAKEATGYSTILYHGESAAERTILVHRGASQKIEQNKIPWNKLQAKWFYITSLGGDLVLLKKLLAHAKKIGVKVAWNPGMLEIKNVKCKMKNFVDILLVNREEASVLTRAPLGNTKKLLRCLTQFAPTAIMTDGPEGAYAIVRTTDYGLPTTDYYIPSGGSKPKNLTGAGDAFGSGFLTGWIKSQGDIKEALRVGTLNANSVVQHIGAKIGILNKYPNQKIYAPLEVQASRSYKNDLRRSPVRGRTSNGTKPTLSTGCDKSK